MTNKTNIPKTNAKTPKKTFKRRELLAGAAVGAAAAPFLTPHVARAQRGKTLRLVTTWPKNFPGVGTGAQRFADTVGRLTDGTLRVQLFAAGELVPPFGSFDAVSQGSADLYHGAEYYWQGKHKAFNYFTAVPFGMTANELDAWVFHNGGQQLWDELSARFNIKPLMAGNTGVQMGGWFNKEINSVNDLNGLTMRMPGLGGEVLRRLGSNAIALPGGEIFPSLQSGKIDATEWVGPWNDLAFGFYKVTKFYYWPGFHEPGSGLAAGVNLDVWNNFTDAEQYAVLTAARAENNLMYSEYNANNSDALDILVNKHRVQLREFPRSVTNEFRRVSKQVLNEISQTDDITNRVHNSFSSSLQKTASWLRIAETAYIKSRDG